MFFFSLRSIMVNQELFKYNSRAQSTLTECTLWHCNDVQVYQALTHALTKHQFVIRMNNFTESAKLNFQHKNQFVRAQPEVNTNSNARKSVKTNTRQLHIFLNPFSFYSLDLSTSRIPFWRIFSSFPKKNFVFDRNFL